METTPAERPHHPYSPSTLQCLEVCPCYQSRSEAHVRAIAGTLAHKVVETREDDENLSDEDAAMAAECADFFDRRTQLMQEARERYVTGAGEHLRRTNRDPSPAITAWEKGTAEVVILTEAYLSVDTLIFSDATATTAGYPDNILVSHCRTHAEIFDWKFGVWAVEQADNNLQGIAYALGLFRAYPTINRITVYFKQPQINAITSANFTRSQVPELYLRVQTIVARARAARQSADFVSAAPHIPACNFCANLGKCPAVLALVCKVGSKFHPLEIPENITPSMVNSPAETSLGMRLLSVVSVWAKAFRSQVTDRVLRGDAPLPAGYKIESKSNREIVDTEKFEQAALKHLTEAEYKSTLSPAFGVTEELISAKAPRGSKKAAVESFQKELLDSGAVQRGDKFSFLKAINEK